MKNYFSEGLQKQLNGAFKTLKINFKVNEEGFEFPKDETNGDLAFACFRLAKEEKKSPMQLATEIATAFNAQKTKSFEAKAAGGYINFTINNENLNEFAKKILTDSNLTILPHSKKLKIVLDCGGANVAKELHMGHLRSPIIGEALKRLYKVFGHEVISDTHLGDYGLQMGLTIAQLEDEGYLKINGTKFEWIKQIELDDLNTVYPRASKRKEVEPDFMKKAENYTLDLQQNKEPMVSIWKVLRNVSVEKIKESYDKLNTFFDLWYGESDAEKYIEATNDVFVKKNLLVESKGSQIIEVKKETDTAPMPPLVFKKTNGGYLYATTDLATIYGRMKEFKPDAIHYVVDDRQSLYFEQVYRAAKLAGIAKPETELLHIAFGTMNGKDGKPFKTRGGDTVKLHKLVDEVTEKAKARLIENGVTEKITNEDELNKLALSIGIAALKFGDLQNNVARDYILDFDKFLSFEGKTGPYLQYTVARINSLIKKANVNEKELLKSNFETFTETKPIIISALKLITTFETAFNEKSLASICTYAYNLASAFSTFYANTKILTESNEKKKTAFLQSALLVKTCLNFVFEVLAIDSVETM